MSIRGHRSDQHLQEAIDYAMEHRPCVISCRTVKALEFATAYFNERGIEARMIRVANFREVAIEARNAFEGGLIDILVVSSALLYVSNGWGTFRRIGCYLASADALIPYRITMFQMLLGNDPDAVNRVFVRRYKKPEVINEPQQD